MMLGRFLFSINCYADLYKPRIDVNKFIKKIESKGENEEIIYENNNMESGYLQIYFRDSFLDRQYNEFNKGVVEYGVVRKKQSYIDYIYAEHFFDCKSKNKIIHSQTFNEYGDYLKSNISYYNFEDSSLKLDQIICSIN